LWIANANGREGVTLTTGIVNLGRILESKVKTQLSRSRKDRLTEEISASWCKIYCTSVNNRMRGRGLTSNSLQGEMWFKWNGTPTGTQPAKRRLFNVESTLEMITQTLKKD
jgi:hypothetical protein